MNINIFVGFESAKRIYHSCIYKFWDASFSTATRQFYCHFFMAIVRELFFYEINGKGARYNLKWFAKLTKSTVTVSLSR